MDKSAHLFVGVAFGVILILLTHYYLDWFDFKSLSSICLMMIIIYIYSLIEDIDTKSSAIVYTFIPIGLIMMFVGYSINIKVYMFIGFGLILVTFFCAQFLPHRGFTHSILFGVLVSVPWIYLSYEYSILAFLCFYSHLMLDKIFFKII
jgi:hypothetical protein